MKPAKHSYMRQDQINFDDSEDRKTVTFEENNLIERMKKSCKSCKFD